MISVLSKPPNRITLEDISSLISEKVPEGAQIEFKECLPSRDGKSDPWSRGEKNIGDYAKNAILEEVVAFANAYGGALVLGIAEDSAQLPVAANVSPVPHCAELAARFKHVFRDRVEPQLPVLDVIPVQTEGDDGIIVFRAGKSRRAPHRVNHAKNLWKCPIRRSDRCEAMGMREIQDMTLNLARGTERMERRLHDRTRKFEDEFKSIQTPDDAFGFRVTAIPVDDDIRFESVYSGGALIQEVRPPAISTMRITANGSDHLRTIPSQYKLHPDDWRPILRGARAEADHILYDRRQQLAYLEIHCDGLLEYEFVANRLFLNDSKDRNKDILDNEIPVSMLHTILAWSRNVREQAYAPSAEFAIYVQIKLTALQMNVGVHNNIAVGEFGITQKKSDGFPIYSLRGPEEIESIVSLFERDFWNHLGREIGEQQGILEIVRL